MILQDQLIPAHTCPPRFRIPPSQQSSHLISFGQRGLRNYQWAWLAELSRIALGVSGCRVPHRVRLRYELDPEEE